MPRPAKRRRVCGMPKVIRFAPEQQNGAEIKLLIEEYETIRLIDHLGFTQEECAAQMNVARTTVQAIYDHARQKIAEALVCGKPFTIVGGSYDVCANSLSCKGRDCRRQKCQTECSGCCRLKKEKSNEKNCSNL